MSRWDSFWLDVRWNLFWRPYGALRNLLGVRGLDESVEAEAAK